MSRRLALTLALPFALALLALAAVTANSSTRASIDAPDPLPAAGAGAGAAASPAAATASVCASGAGTFVSSLSTHVDLASLPDLSRRAFAAERLAERANRPLPQRMGVAVPATIPPTCIP